MRYFIPLAILALMTVGVGAAQAAQKVHFIVHVPADTTATDNVYIAGSLPAVGEWKAEGFKLTRQDDGTYTGDVELKAGDKLDFKVNRGTWETVEKKADGSERDNRSQTIDESTKDIDVTVERWADRAPKK